MTSLIRSPEPLFFDHWFHSPCHGLNQWSNVTLRRSNFIPRDSSSPFLWNTGQVSCKVLFTSLHIISMGFISGARGSQSMSSTSACSDSHSSTTRESRMEEWSCWKWIIPLRYSIRTEGSTTLCKMCWYWRLFKWHSIRWSIPATHWCSCPNREQTHGYCVCR